MAVVKRYLAADYPNTVLGTYATVQTALNAIPDPRTQAEIVEVEASEGTSEAIAGFTYIRKQYSEHLLTIRPAEGHEITIDFTTGNQAIGISTHLTSDDDFGNILIQDFIINAAAGSDANAINISGAKSGGVGCDIRDVTFKNITGIFSNRNRVRIEHADDIVFEDCYFESDGHVVRLDADFNNYSSGHISFLNSHFKYIGNTPDDDVINMAGDMIERVTFNGCEIEGGTRYGIFLRFPKRADIWRCKIHGQGERGVMINGKNADNRTELFVDNSVFWGQGDRAIVVNSHANNISIKQNTFIFHPPDAGFCCIDLYDVEAGIDILGNIFALAHDFDIATLLSFVRIRYRAGVTISDQVFNYNVFYKTPKEGNDANVRLYDIGVLSGTNQAYADLTDIQAIGLDLNSVHGDPLFEDNECDDDNWFEIDQNSPARDLVLQHSLSPFDIRRWHRQVYFQDSGCWDYDADPNEVPESDEIVTTHDIYRESDNTPYANIHTAILAQEKQTQNETIIIRTEGLGAADKHPSVWFNGRENTRGYALTLKAHDDLVAAGKKVKMGSGGGLCFNLDGSTNMIFENFHFEADGMDDPYCFRIQVKGANNIIFKNCKFSNARNPFYAVIANSVEFYDCEFTECNEYCLDIGQGDRVLIERCTFNIGSQYPSSSGAFTQWENRVLIRIVNVLRSEIRHCIFDEPKMFGVGKFDVGIRQLWYGNIFRNIQWRAHWFIPGVFRDSGHVLFHSNLWDNCASQVDAQIILSQGIEDFTFINNTVIHTLFTDIDCIFIREHRGKIKVFNNYFELSRTSYNGGRVLRAQMDDMEIGLMFQSNNNFFNLQGITPLTPIYRVGDANHTAQFDTLDDLQNAGLDDDSFELRAPAIESELENDGSSLYAPKDTSDLIDNADLSKTFEILDLEGNFIGADPDIGAVTSGAAVPVPAAPVIDFDIIERYEEPYTVHNYDSGLSTPYIVPKLDPLELVSRALNFPDYIQWRIKQSFDPVTILDIQLDSSNTRIFIAGNHMESISDVPVFQILNSTNNNGIYDRVVAYYDPGLIQTVVVIVGNLDTAIIDGDLHWENVPVGGIGKSVLFSFPHKDMLFDLHINMVNDSGSDHIVIPLVWDVKAGRPVGSFKLNKNILFAGDTVSFISMVQFTTGYKWTIETPSGIIEPTTQNVDNILYDQAGEYNVSLEIENEDNIKGTLTKSPGVFVEEIPDAPHIDFNSQNQVAYSDQTINLNADIQGFADAPISRFLTGDEVFLWEIVNSKTGDLIHSLTGKNVSFVWNSISADWGYFDVYLKVHSETWGGKQKIERRYLTIIPTIAGKTTHDIHCDPSNTYVEPGGTQTRTASLIMGTDPNQTGALNNSLIQAGHVIRLSGQARELRLYDLYGTPENPIVVVCNYDLQDQFKVITQSWTGIETNRCEWVIVTGKPTNGVKEFGIFIGTNPDPVIYFNTPGNSGFKVEKFSEHVHGIGLEIDLIKFAGVMVKTNPSADDPTTWRNVGDPRMMGVVIGHCKVSNCNGEGIYTGHFTEGIAGYGSAESGMQGTPYYAQMIGDHIVFRNQWINCGFDGIQVGCAYLGLNEVHHNDIINPGYLRVFGQNAAMSLNWIKGWIYNNRCEGHIIPKAGVPGDQLIFNNIITSLTRVDAIYYLCDTVDLWDTEASPAQIVTNNYDYRNNFVRVFNNLIVTNRNALVFNARDDNDYIPKIDMVNNIVLYSVRAWRPYYDHENPDRQKDIITLQNTSIELPQEGTIVQNNIIERIDDIDFLGMHDVADDVTIVGSLKSDSPAITQGHNLSGIYPANVLFDYFGYLLPALSGNYHVGVMAWFPVNYTPVSFPPVFAYLGQIPVTAAFLGNKPIINLLT